MSINRSINKKWGNVKNIKTKAQRKEGAEYEIGLRSLFQFAERQREEHIKQMSEFCFETALSIERNINLLERAKQISSVVTIFAQQTL